MADDGFMVDTMSGNGKRLGQCTPVAGCPVRDNWPELSSNAPMPKSRQDRRVVRTQQSLHEALIELVLEKGYEAVSVGDIVARANVGRSTFYAHHGGKESLLVSGIQHLRGVLLQAAQERTAGGRLFAFSEALFAHADTHRDLYRALVVKDTGVPVSQRMFAMVLDLVRRELAATAAPKAIRVPCDAAARFATEAMFSILTWWLDSGAKISPSEADALFRKLAMPGLVAAGWRQAEKSA